MHKCEHCGGFGDACAPVKEFKEGIVIGGEKYFFLHDECEKELKDVYSDAGPDPMHPNETSQEFWDHEDKG